MTDDPRARFGGVAAQYQRGRPSYAPALVDWALARAGLPEHARPRPPWLADVGCGTGLAARLFAERGYRVVGVDPSMEMLAQAVASGGGPRYVRGEASTTGLAPASVALVVVAQALHWFDLDLALSELQRVLLPGGACAAFWNQRVEGPFEQEYDGLLRRFSSEYVNRSHAAPVLAALRARPDLVDVSEACFATRQELDRDSFFDRVHSSSYVAHGVADQAGFDAALGDLFDRHQRSGRVAFDYETPSMAWRFAARG